MTTSDFEHLSMTSELSNILPIENAFQIKDFTIPSDFERFIHNIETLLNEWNLTGGNEGNQNDEEYRRDKSSSRPSSVKKQVLSFHSFEFNFSYHNILTKEKTKNDENEENGEFLTLSSDFNSASFHALNYFYGLQHFLIIGPFGHETLCNESRINFVLSAVTIACQNTQCEVPTFVQGFEKSQNFYQGISLYNSYRTDYQMIHLKVWPSHLNYLAGLQHMFETKISKEPLSSLYRKIKISVRLSYVLKEWKSKVWNQAYPDLYFTDIHCLPFGSPEDPLASIYLAVSWRDLEEGMITDTRNHSDLNPILANEWSIRIHPQDKPHLFLTNCLQVLLKTCDRNESFRDLLGDFNSRDDETSVPRALTKLTGPTYSLTDIITSGTQELTNYESPLPVELLKKYLNYIFPNENNYPDFTSQKKETIVPDIKSCPIDGLLWRLCVILIHCQAGSIKASAQILQAFMFEIRVRWESGTLLPGLPFESPNYSYSLFHQKLQMINCCIQCKVLRETQKSTQKPQEEEKTDDENDEDEFFECEEEDDIKGSLDWKRIPEGRSEIFKKSSKLLNHQNVFLYIPVLQEPSPRTEDQIAEQAELYMIMKETNESSDWMAQIQSLALSSDMESFKAANPQCVFEDFIRWYSPRDWNEETKEVSERMTSKDNLWSEIWKNAKPVPAQRQKRLFDETKDAENILYYFSSLKIGKIFELLLPTFFHISFLRLLQESQLFSRVPHLSDIINEIKIKIEKGSLISSSEKGHSLIFNDALKLLRLAEHKLSLSLSLLKKFESSDELPLKTLLSENEIYISGGAFGPTGKILTELLREESEFLTSDSKNPTFPSPVSKEYILRTSCPRPYTFSKSVPHQMYVCLKPHEIRICGAFSIDKT